MKTAKKVPRVFRLVFEVDSQLRRRSEVTGIPQTRILENALRSYFAKGMSEDMKDASNRLKSFNPALDVPPELHILAA